MSFQYAAAALAALNGHVSASHAQVSSAATPTKTEAPTTASSPFLAGFSNSLLVSSILQQHHQKNQNKPEPETVKETQPRPEEVTSTVVTSASTPGIDTPLFPPFPSALFGSRDVNPFPFPVSSSVLPGLGCSQMGSNPGISGSSDNLKTGLAFVGFKSKSSSIADLRLKAKRHQEALGILEED